jgi:lipoprotein
MRGRRGLRERWPLVVVLPVLTLAVACEVQQAFREASALCAGLDVVCG